MLDEAVLEAHRAELRGYCYRMLGSATDAEDAVQDTLARAWRARERFEGRASARTWLYRIASNVCFDALAAGKRRAIPTDFEERGIDLDRPMTAQPWPEQPWVGPALDDHVIDASALDPASLAQVRASVRLALVAALQHLPPRQRAVLILRDVLRLSAAETAELLEMSEAAANSALQRARATLAARDVEVTEVDEHDVDDEHRDLLDRYVAAFEAYDVDALKLLLHEDAIQTMPPWPIWLEGRDAIGRWMLTYGLHCRGSVLRPLRINGTVGFAQWRDGGQTPWGVSALDIEDGRVKHIRTFLETDGSLFASFGLPAQLEAALPAR